MASRCGAADVMHSDWDCTLEGLPHPPAVRLGLRMVAGLRRSRPTRILAARSERPFDSAEDLARRAGLEQHEMTLLAAADALMSLAGHRRQQVWEAAALRSTPELLRDAPVDEEVLELPAAPEGEEVVLDYAATGLTLRRHPLALLRPLLAKQRLVTAAELHDLPNGRLVRSCGIVTRAPAAGDRQGRDVRVAGGRDRHASRSSCWKLAARARSARNCCGRG